MGVPQQAFQDYFFSSMFSHPVPRCFNQHSYDVTSQIHISILILSSEYPSISYVIWMSQTFNLNRHMIHKSPCLHPATLKSSNSYSSKDYSQTLHMGNFFSVLSYSSILFQQHKYASTFNFCRLQSEFIIFVSERCPISIPISG